MTLATDIAGDFALVADNLEAATLKRPGSSATTAITNALRRAISTDQAAESQGKYTRSDVVWHFPVSEGTPHVGDILVPTTAPSERWTILDYSKETLGARWRCVCRDIAIAFGLSQVFTIRQVQTKRGPRDAAADYSQFKEVRTGFRGKLQVDSITPEVSDGRQGGTVTARFYMYEAFELDGTHLVVEANGTEWGVESYLGLEEIGQAPQAVLTRDK